MNALQTIPRRHVDIPLPDVSLSHLAIRPPRADVIGEVVYAARWVEFTGAAPASWHDCHESTHLHGILGHITDEPTQRQATLAATFIQWLGTNCGKGMLEFAKRLRSVTREAHLAAWAIENTRTTGINGGFRALEAIMAPQELYRQDGFGVAALCFPPDLSLDDYETVEHVVRWLDQPEGGGFVRRCESDIERRCRERAEVARRDFRELWNGMKGRA